MRHSHTSHTQFHAAVTVQSHTSPIYQSLDCSLTSLERDYQYTACEWCETECEWRENRVKERSKFLMTKSDCVFALESNLYNKLSTTSL